MIYCSNTWIIFSLFNCYHNISEREGLKDRYHLMKRSIEIGCFLVCLFFVCFLRFFLFVWWFFWGGGLCILISLIYKWVCYLLTRRKEAKVKRQQRDIVCMQRELCELTRLMHIANTQALSLDLAIDQTKMEMASLCSQSEFCGKMFRYNIIIVYVHQQHVKAPKLYILLARET